MRIHNAIVSIIVLTFLLALMAPLQMESVSASGFAGGNGSQEQPYVIETLEQLNSTRDHLHSNFILANDIDASATISWDGGYGFKPIGTEADPFNGTLDGNGHIISGLFINRTLTDHVGLFGQTGATAEIKSIGLVNANVSGKWYVGGLVGRNYGEISENSYATGNVNGSSDVGGLVGYNEGNISGSHATVDVDGGDALGGLVGYNEGNISGSHAAGDVSGREAGGLVGYNAGLITLSYSTGDVNGCEDIGGLVGWNDGNISESYATGDVNGTVWCAGGLVGSNFGTIYKSHASGEVSGEDSVGGLVGSSANIMNGSYATGKVSGMDRVGGLAGYNEGIIHHCYATGDAEGQDRVGGLVGENEGPIEASHATGDVEARSEAGGLAGISRLSGDITLSFATGEVNVSGGSAGGLVGDIDDITLNASYATGNVTASERAGGLVGINVDGTISYSYATGTVRKTGSNEGTGGLVGDNDGVVSFSFATGDVYGQSGVGGLIGFTTADVMNSFALGDVNGTGSNTGGLSGEVDRAEIHDSFALGDVSGNIDVGGLVGFMTGALLNRTYSVGMVDGNTDVGGLVGRNESSEVLESYWDNESADTEISALGQAKTTMAMMTQATFEGWDFDEVWWMAEGQTYPLLRNDHWAPVIVSDPPVLPEYGEFIAGMAFHHIVESDQDSSYYWMGDADFLDFSAEGTIEGTLEPGVFMISVTPVSAFLIPGDNQSFTLTVSDKVLVTGLLTDHEGNPAQGVEIRSDEDLLGSSDSDGVFKFLVEPDEYDLVFLVEGLLFPGKSVTATTGEVLDLGTIVALHTETENEDYTLIYAGAAVIVIIISALLIRGRL